MSKKFLAVLVGAFLLLPTMAKADTNSYVSVIRQVRNVSQGGVMASSAAAQVGDTLAFSVRVQNVSSAVLSNVFVTDTLQSSYSVRYNLSSSRLFTGSFENGGIQFATLEAGGIVDINYTVQVLSSAQGNANSCTTSGAGVMGQNVSSSTCVYLGVTGAAVATTIGSGSVLQSVSVSNDTKNTSGASLVAAKEDFLTFAFTATNSGTIAQSAYSVSVDLAGVLPLVDVVDLNGGSLSGNTLTYPATSIAVGQSITRTLRVRVKYYLPPYGFVLKVAYGNQLQVSIPAQSGHATYVPPATGGNTAVASALLFALGFVALFVLFRSQRVRTFLFN
jgi:uncharacterized repeat protein (TIGR01451 family)